MGQPTHSGLPQAKPLPIPMHWKMFVHSNSADPILSILAIKTGMSSTRCVITVGSSGMPVAYPSFAFPVNQFLFCVSPDLPKFGHGLPKPRFCYQNPYLLTEIPFPFT
jgi:hypothetical protein